MTDADAFDLEPPKRTYPARRSSRRLRAEPKDTPASAKATGAAAVFGWLVSPCLYLLLGLVLAAGLMLCLYNPSWGTRGTVWPYEVFGLENGLFVFGPDDAAVSALLLCALGCLIGLSMKPGLGRGALGVFAAAAVLAPSAPQSMRGLWNGAWLPTITIAAVAAALIARHGGQVEGRRRMLLGIGVLALAAALFFPADGTAYASAGLDHIKAMTDGTDMAEIKATLPQSVGILLLAVGLASLLGLGGGWARWAGGFLVLLLALALPIDAYGSASGTWSERLADMVTTRSWGQWVWLLPLTAGLADLMRPRR